MYQLEIVTPQGTVRSGKAEKQEILEFVKTIQDSDSLTVELENGTTFFITKGMIDSSVFFVVPADE
jgi:hypothetical protein